MANLVKSFLSAADYKDLEEAIRQAEQRTSGELRVAIRHKRGRKEKAMSVEQLARHEFVRLGMMRTVDRTGILIFILLESREFFILADEHINQKVAPQTWQTVAQAMATHFTRREFRNGLLHAVKAVGDELARHFPPTSGDKNELPNTVQVS